MNNKEYEQKRRECWEEYCKTHPLCNTPVMRLNFDWTFDRAYALGKQAAELSSNSEQLNAEGEEMLWVSRKEIQQLVAANDVVILEAAGNIVALARGLDQSEYLTQIPSKNAN